MFSSFSQWYWWWSCWCLLFLCNGFDGAFANVLFLFVIVLLVLFLMPSSFLWCPSYSIHHILLFFIPFFLFYLSSSPYFLYLVLSILHVLFTMLPSSSSQPSLLLLILLLPHPPPSPLFHLYHFTKWCRLATWCPHAMSILTFTWLLTSFWSSIMTPRLTPLYPNLYAS
jgi:hypothetical protein